MRYIIFLIVCALCSDAKAEMFQWKVIKIIDADTLRVSAPWSPLPDKTIDIRLHGIDTPEHGWRAQCDSERNKAHQATYFVEQAIRDANIIETQPLGWEKYGRILANVWLDNKNLSQMLLDAGLAKPYHGEKKSSWCASNVQ